MKSKFGTRKLFSNKRLKLFASVTSILTLLVFIFMALIPKIMAGNTVVNDLTIQATANEKIINVVVTDQNESDTKIILPLPEGVVYHSSNQQIIGVTEDTANHQLVIDWVEGQDKNVMLQLEAECAGTYDFVVNTVRDGEPVSSPISTIELEEIPSSETQNSSTSEDNTRESSDSNVKTSTSEEEFDTNNSDNEKPINYLKLTDNSITCSVSRNDETESAPSETELNTFYDNSLASININLKNQEQGPLIGKLIINLPEGIYQRYSGRTSSSMMTIGKEGFVIGPNENEVEYTYNNQTRQIIIPNVEIQEGQDARYTLDSVIYEVTKQEEKSKEITIPMMFESMDSSSISFSPKVIVYNFGQTSTFDNLSATDENDVVLSKNENDEFIVHNNQKKLNFIGDYLPMNKFGGHPIVSRYYEYGTENELGKTKYVAFKFKVDDGFERPGIKTKDKNVEQILREVMHYDMLIDNMTNDGNVDLNYGLFMNSPFDILEGAPASARNRTLGSESIEWNINFSADTSKWDYDKLYKIDFVSYYGGYDDGGVVEWPNIVLDTYKFIKKRPSPEVQQSLNSKNENDDGANYVGDKFLYSVNIENTISDSSMTNVTNTISVPYSMNVDKNSIEVLDSSGQKLENVNIQYLEDKRTITISGDDMALAGKDKRTVQYRAVPVQASTYETKSQVVYSDSYGNPMKINQVTNTLEVKNIDGNYTDTDFRPEDATKFNPNLGLTTLTKDESTAMVYKIENNGGPRDETLSKFDLWFNNAEMTNEIEVDKSSFYIKKNKTADWEHVNEDMIDSTTGISVRSYTIKDMGLKLIRGERIEVKFSITAKSPIPITPDAIVAQGTNLESGGHSIVNSLVVKNGTLRFEKVPDKLSFNDSKISNRTVEIERKEKDWEMIVEDTRASKSSWRITAKIESGFKDEFGNSIKINPLLFRKSGQVDQWITEESEINVFNGTSTTEDYYNVSWTEKEGPLLQVAPGTVKVGQYKGVLEWNLIDAPV